MVGKNVFEIHSEEIQKQLDIPISQMCVSCIYLTHPILAKYDTRSIFKQDLTGSKSQFFFSLTDYHIKVKWLNLPNNLYITGRRIFRFMPFSRILALYEVQIASSRV